MGFPKNSTKRMEVPLTNEELLELGQRFADLSDRKEVIDGELAQAQSVFKAAKATHEEQMGEVATELRGVAAKWRTRRAMKSVPIIETIEPENGPNVVTQRRADTGEIVGSRALTETEIYGEQQALPLGDQSAAPAAEQSDFKANVATGDVETVDRELPDDDDEAPAAKTIDEASVGDVVDLDDDESAGGVDDEPTGETFGEDV